MRLCCGEPRGSFSSHRSAVRVGGHSSRPAPTLDPGWEERAMSGIPASPTVDYEPVQLIAPDGTATTESAYVRDLPPETLCWLYEMMVVTRELDEEFVNLQRQGELALFPSCRGQEAAQVGATACLRKTDWLFPQYRELGAFLVRGISPS